MTDKPDFTMGDLLQQLAAEFGYTVNDYPGTDVYTSSELSEALGISQYKIVRVIKDKYKKGEIEVTKKKVECFGSGRLMTVQGYKLKNREMDDGEN